MLTVDINKAMLVYCNQSATCDDSAEICNAKIWPANFHFLWRTGPPCLTKCYRGKLKSLAKGFSRLHERQTDGLCYGKICCNSWYWWCFL